jgi:hypothetical protein
MSEQRVSGEWMKIMLEEIARKKEEVEQARIEERRREQPQREQPQRQDGHPQPLC